MALETPFSPLSFGKSFMKIRSAIPENGCLIFMHYRGGQNKKLSCCWETVRRESMPRIAEVDVEMTT